MKTQITENNVSFYSTEKPKKKESTNWKNFIEFHFLIKKKNSLKKS